jgi:hypothetical protein
VNERAGLLAFALVDVDKTKEAAGAVISLSIDPAPGRVAAVVVIVLAVGVVAGGVGNEDRSAAKPVVARAATPVAAARAAGSTTGEAGRWRKTTTGRPEAGVWGCAAG